MVDLMVKTIFDPSTERVSKNHFALSESAVLLRRNTQESDSVNSGLLGEYEMCTMLFSKKNGSVICGK
jgi:hypothetical protein